MDATILIVLTIIVITVLLGAFGIEWDKNKNNN